MGRDRASSEDLNTAVPADAVARWPCLLGGPGVELGGRAGRIGPGCAGRYAQVPQDPRNGARFRDRPDDLAPASAAGTAQDLDQKDPAQQPGPRHSVRRHYWSIRAAVSWRGHSLDARRAPCDPRPQAQRGQPARLKKGCRPDPLKRGPGSGPERCGRKRLGIGGLWTRVCAGDLVESCLSG